MEENKGASDQPTGGCHTASGYRHCRPAGPYPSLRLKVDDNKRGGEIDLLVGLHTPIADCLELESRLGALLHRAMQGHWINVVLAAPNIDWQFIHSKCPCIWSPVVMADPGLFEQMEELIGIAAKELNYLWLYLSRQAVAQPASVFQQPATAPY